MIYTEKIISGHIYTANDAMPFAEAMYIKDGVIRSIGSLRAVLRTSPKGVYHERAEGLILPGCSEGHAHISCTIDKLYGIDFSSLESVEEYCNSIISYIEKHPTATVITGQGYRNGIFPKLEPNKHLLDQICEEQGIDVPMIFESEDCHSFWVNSKALELADYKSDTGWIREWDKFYFEPLLPKYTVDDYKIAILHYQELATIYGITMAYEPMLSSRNEYDIAIQAYTELALEKKLHIHFRMSYPVFDHDDIDEVIKRVLELKKNTDSEYFKILGVKFFMDGVVEGHTAYLSEPYADTPGDRSICLWDSDHLKYAFLQAQKNNLQIHIHAVGDGALEVALNALESVNAKMDITKSRHSITHLQIVKPEQIARMAKLGIIAVLNPYWHLISEDYYYNLETPYLGKYRVEHEYPVKDFIDAGVTCTQASDFPVTIPPNLWVCLGLAVARKKPDSSFPPHNPSQKIDCFTALKMFTINGARQLFLDDHYGSLEAGKSADYLILNADPFHIPEDELFNLHVNQYVVKGMRI